MADKATMNKVSPSGVKAPGLIADIGATNARFALADENGIFEQKVLKCDDYPGIVEAAVSYLEQTAVAQAPKSASVAIAGPIVGDRFDMTNHPWSFSIKETQERLRLERLTVMNDFRAIALAIPHLKGSDIRQLGGGTPQKGAPIGIIGPGTGLGVASLVWTGTRYIPVPGEGGHVTMPAKNQRELDIFLHLRHKYRHVSAERVCSGKGLANIYDTLRALDGRMDLPDLTPEQISRMAMEGSCDLCRESLDLMLGFLGTIAGNLAMTLGTHGGIYIAGGIIMQLGEYFDQSCFRQEFLAKGRMESYLAPIPTFVIQNPFIAFIGLHAELVATENI